MASPWRVFAYALLLLKAASTSEVTLQGQRSHADERRSPCPAGLSVEISSPVVLPNRSVFDELRNATYPRGKWYEVNSTGTARYLGCLCDLSKPCLRKCCPRGQSYKWGRENGCVRNSRDFRVIVSRDVKSTRGNSVLLIDEYHLLFGTPCEKGDYRLRPENYFDNAYHVRSDGVLSLPWSEVEDLGPDGHCFESDAESGDEGKPFVCLERLGKGDSWSLAGFSFWRTLPMVFLLYSILSRVVPRDSGRAPITGKNGTCMLISLLAARISYVLVTVMSTRVTDMDTFSLALVVQFFLLSSAFWYNTVCLETFLATRDRKSPFTDIAAYSPAKSSALEARNFIASSIYSLGWPLAITITSGMTTGLSEIPRNQVNPKHSLTQIWFRANSITQGCLLGSDAVLLCCNLFLCLITAATLLATRDKAPSSSDTAWRNKLKERLLTCVSLQLIIAANRASEASVWMTPEAQGRLGILDLANGLQDTAISVILAWGDITLAFESTKSWFRRRLPDGDASESIRRATGITPALWLIGWRLPGESTSVASRSRA